MRGSASQRVDEVIDDKNKQNQSLGQNSGEPLFSENRLFFVLRYCSFSFSELLLYSWLTSVNYSEAADAGPAVRNLIGMIFSDLIVYWISILFFGLVIFSYCQIRQCSLWKCHKNHPGNVIPQYQAESRASVTVQIHHRLLLSTRDSRAVQEIVRVSVPAPTDFGGCLARM